MSPIGNKVSGPMVNSLEVRPVTTPVGIAVQEDNTVACCFEPTDLNTFMEVLESPESAEAMGTDSVKRDTVKLYVIDREFQP